MRPRDRCWRCDHVRPTRRTGSPLALTSLNMKAEVLVELRDVLSPENGVTYHAHACGAPMTGGGWQGWVEFLPLDGREPVRTGRETTQPNRTDAVYWATGLTPVYLEGALERALNPLVVHHVDVDTPAFEEPAPTMRMVGTPTAGHRSSIARRSHLVLSRQP